jgi:hypothetical protein
MGFHVFEESEVQAAILKKAPISVKSGKRSAHKTAFLELDGYKFSHFRIPNNHKKGFSQNKARELAKKLLLDDSQYFEFVSCKMKKGKYQEHLAAAKVKGEQAGKVGESNPSEEG